VDGCILKRHNRKIEQKVNAAAPGSDQVQALLQNCMTLQACLGLVGMVLLLLLLLLLLLFMLTLAKALAQVYAP